ncbi:DMT family transporter [Halostella litorea]|uniref:DMT family transporter n=1 Tax=Halostella litorea TaxID=2528831 RepID=UPI0010919A79|nr:DMT family transporter [Halostella litorea]
MSESVADRVPPMGALAVAVVAVSTSAILVRWSAASSAVMAFYRVLFTVALVAPVAAARHAADFRRLSLRDGVAAVVAGVALAVHFASWFESLNHTSVAASVTLVQTQPVFVAAGAAVLLNERVSRRVAGGIGVAVVGAAAMSLTGGGTAAVGGRATFGNALAVLGAVTAAGYVLAGRSVRQRVALFPYVTVVYAACAATLFALVAAGDAPLVDYPPREWLLFVAMAVGPGVFGHTVVNWALEHVESSVVSVSLLGEPVGSTLLAALLLAEIPSAATALGGAVVLAGIYVTTTERAGSAP